MMTLKGILKKSAVLRKMNAVVKCSQKKKDYADLCAFYGTPSVLTDRDEFVNLSVKSFSALYKEQCEPPPEGIRALFVGTDWDQDRSGIVQGLERLCELAIFEHIPGRPGQKWPETESDFEKVRFENGKRLVEVASRMRNEKKLDLVIGQMWGLSMDFRALETLRTWGVRIVNISMDDRHSFRGRRMKDGTWRGVLALIPYLDLACTDAPECVRWYEAEGCRAIFLAEASDSSIFHPSSVGKSHDVAFVGSKYGIRAAMVAALEKACVRVQAFGNGWPLRRIPTESVPGLFRESKIVLGCGTIGHCDDFLALKLRDFDGPMSGSLYITHDNPDLFGAYAVGKEVALFSNIKDMVEKVKYYLEHDVERETIEHMARERALRCHTWEQRFRVLLRRAMEQ